MVIAQLDSPDRADAAPRMWPSLRRVLEPSRHSTPLIPSKPTCCSKPASSHIPLSRRRMELLFSTTWPSPSAEFLSCLLRSAGPARNTKCQSRPLDTRGRQPSPHPSLQGCQAARRDTSQVGIRLDRLRGSRLRRHGFWWARGRKPQVNSPWLPVDPVSARLHREIKRASTRHSQPWEGHPEDAGIFWGTAPTTGDQGCPIVSL